MYNIITTCNHQYRHFGHILINSILANCDSENLSKIIVGDVGLTELDREEISAISSKIHIVNTPLRHENEVATHSREWIELVSIKTYLLQSYLETEKLPIVMLDVDQVIMADFIPVAKIDVPITVCERKIPAIRPDGMRLDYIASFLIANNSAAIEMVAEWRQLIEARIAAKLQPGFETPALCEMLSTKKLGTDFSVVIDEEYSSPNIYLEGKTRILHCKSEGPHDSEDFLERRMSQVTGIDKSLYKRYVASCST